LIKDNVLTLGVIYNPFLDRIIYAEKGNGAFLDGKKIVADQKAPAKQTISIIAGYPNQHLQKQMMFDMSDTVYRILTHWAPSIDFMLLCTGKIDSIISLESETEDQLAGILIAKEAGCSVKTIDGKDFNITEFSEYLPKIIISRSKQSYADMMGLIR